MSESMVLELIGRARDEARSHALFQLAEHLDDAMLIAASQFHAAVATREGCGRYDGGDTKAVREPASPRLN